ncbi:hypothetical protein LUX32_51260 [Actinomadura madurae]|nr:hypothetical protein [Actinomadura madurae]MCP9984991.1 hypothetical protein [Actinomadura madurae]
MRVARENPTSAGRRPAGSARWARSEAARARSASPVRAEIGRTSARASGSGPVSRTGSGSSGPGPCSRMTWALVPLAPKDDTPARRGRSGTASHGRGSASSSTAPADQSTREEGRSTCRVAGSTSCRMASTIFITPATPDAAWVCPRLDFSEPSHSGLSRSCP